MNIQSWILLLAILAIVSYIVYTRFVAKAEGKCSDCPGCAPAKDKHSCCS